MRLRLLALLAWVVSAHPVAPILLAAAVSAACLAGSGEIPYSTSRIDLIPPDHPARRRFLEIVDRFGPQNPIVVVIEGGSSPARTAFADRVSRDLLADPEFHGQVFHRLDPKPFADRGPLYLETSRLEELRRAAGENREFIDALPDLARALTVLDSRMERAEARGLDALPEVLPQALQLAKLLRLMTEALDGGRPSGQRWLDALSTGPPPLLELFDGTGHLVSRDGSMHFVFVIPDRQSEEMAYLEPFVGRIRKAMDEAGGRLPGVRGSLAGLPIGVIDEQNSARRDLPLASLAAVLGNLLILIVGFWRRPLMAALTMLSLGAGIVWTMAFARAALGSLNLISSVFVLFLIGMGINYGIYIASRFEIERRRGLEPEGAMRRTLLGQGPGVISSAAASCVAFLALCLCPFRGFRELGLLAAVGLFFCLIAALLLLPCLMMVTEGRGRRRRATPEGPAGAGETRARHFPIEMLVLVAALTAIAAVEGEFFPFSYDLNGVLPADAESLVAGEKLLKGQTLSPMSAIVVCRDLREVQERTRRLRASPEVRATLSRESFVPGDLERKRAVLTGLAEQLESAGAPRAASVRPASAGVERACREFSKRLENGGATLERLRHYPEGRALGRARRELERFRAKAAGLAPAVSAASLAAAGEALLAGWLELAPRARQWASASAPDASFVPAPLRGALESRDGHYAIIVAPRDDISRKEAFDRFHEAVARVDANASGYPVMIHAMVNLLPDVLKDTWAQALLFIVLLLALDFRRPGLILLALCPVVLGSAWLMGLMKAFGWQYNQVNFLALPMILGVGIENGVNFGHALEGVWRYDALDTQALGMILSAGTSVVGFEALSLASHRGLASFGELLSVGTVTCLVAALVALPSLVRVWARRRAYRLSLSRVSRYRFY